MLISGRDNPKIKEYNRLAASKKYRREQGCFVIEGMINCIDILALAEEGAVEVTALFYTEEALEKYRGTLDVHYIEEFSRGGSYVITDSIAEKMSGVGQTQGAFAVAKMLDRKLGADALAKDGRYLVLDNVQDPGNLGTMIRTAAAVGINGVILSGNSVDLYNPKVVRSAMASMPRVELYIENDFEKTVRILGDVGLVTYAAVVDGGTDVTETDFSGGCAVVIGNEGRGLSDSDAAMCDKSVTISMKGHMDSLNAAAAGAIILWEMSGRGR